MVDLLIDYEKWAQPKPFGYSGCFRLRNESQFMASAILSHLPFLDEAVLVVQPSDDNTLELAYDLADKYKRIKVFEYPLIPDWIDTPGFYEKDPDQPGHLVHMSNWALSKCEYSWIVKVEGDVICLPAFSFIRRRINSHNREPHYYGRVILNIAGENMDQISEENPRNGGWDEAVVPNSPDYHFKRVAKWEILQNPGSGTCLGLSGLHMKRCKESKTDGWNGETYVPLLRETLVEILKAHGLWPGDLMTVEDEIDLNWESIIMVLEGLR